VGGNDKTRAAANALLHGEEKGRNGGVNVVMIKLKDKENGVLGKGRRVGPQVGVQF